MLALFQVLVQAEGKKDPMEHETVYRTTQIDGLSILCREAGLKDAATILLHHGLPPLSRIFELLLNRLMGESHMVARGGRSQRSVFGDGRY